MFVFCNCVEQCTVFQRNVNWEKSSEALWIAQHGYERQTRWCRESFIKSTKSCCLYIVFLLLVLANFRGGGGGLTTARTLIVTHTHKRRIRTNNNKESIIRKPGNRIISSKRLMQPLLLYTYQHCNGQVMTMWLCMNSASLKVQWPCKHPSKSAVWSHFKTFAQLFISVKRPLFWLWLWLTSDLENMSGANVQDFQYLDRVYNKFCIQCVRFDRRTCENCCFKTFAVEQQCDLERS